MAGFIYNGKSSLTIADEPLHLCGLEAIDAVPGMTREKREGEITISHPITNEYGTVIEHLEFEYALTKCGGYNFTEIEQREIEKWLTSPKLSSTLEVLDDYGITRYKYYGLFTNTEWLRGNGGYCAVKFTFVVNGRYPFEHYEHEFKIPMGSPADTVLEHNIFCDSDELEEYIYPVIYAVPRGSNTTFTIENLNEFESMQITSTRKQDLQIDCDNCICSWGKNYANVASYSSIGWSEADSIYWFRLVPGDNPIRITGNVDITFSYDAPLKKVGGWL